MWSTSLVRGGDVAGLGVADHLTSVWSLCGMDCYACSVGEYRSAFS